MSTPTIGTGMGAGSGSGTGFGSIGDYFKMGFGLSLGEKIVSIIFTVLGLIFFIPGMILVMKEYKKPKNERSKTRMIIGFVLMMIGMVMGMSFGLGIVIAMFSNEMTSEY